MEGTVLIRSMRLYLASNVSLTSIQVVVKIFLHSGIRSLTKQKKAEERTFSHWKAGRNCGNPGNAAALFLFGFLKARGPRVGNPPGQ